MQEPLNPSNSAVPGYATLERFGEQHGIVSPRRLFRVVTVVNVLVFMVTVILNNLLLLDHRNVLLILENVGFICFSTALASRRKGVFYAPIGASGIVAILLGVLIGMVCYDSLGYFTLVYSGSRTYQNIVASTSAAAVADAGRIVFSNEAVVDQSNAVGYSARDGTMYCAAPVRDLSETTAVQFWAVGWNCCDLTGNFECDAAKNGDAHGGIVVFDSPGTFRDSNKDWYDKTRRKAEAQFDIVSSEEPLYVRWVHSDDLNMLVNYYRKWVVIFILVATICYAIPSSLLTWLFCRFHYHRFFCKAG
mmetsp:Transcript_136838/g.249466  ORF Transcript_136838/g.249466 Transcript_136838/m.249466 type:complete len:305 (-) Transcript_136838:95-1009(-)